MSEIFEKAQDRLEKAGLSRHGVGYFILPNTGVSIDLCNEDADKDDALIYVPMADLGKYLPGILAPDMLEALEADETHFQHVFTCRRCGAGRFGTFCEEGAELKHKAQKLRLAAIAKARGQARLSSTEKEATAP